MATVTDPRRVAGGSAFPTRRNHFVAVQFLAAILSFAFPGRLAAGIGPEIKPKLYVLSVGVSEYQKQEYQMYTAAKDAGDFAAAFSAQKGLVYQDVESRVLTDARATRDAILDGLDWIQKQTTSRDVAVVFLSGLWMNGPRGGVFFLPVNADAGGLDDTCVAFSSLKDVAETVGGKLILFVDTCYPAEMASFASPDIVDALGDLRNAEVGTVVFTSSAGRQYSEDEVSANGVFVRAIVEALGGGADYTGSGRITVNMLDLYISEKVKDLAKGKQTPLTLKPSGFRDFPIALKATR